jgi:putative hemolysin
MTNARSIAAISKAPRFAVGLARHGDEVADAQRLRWRVFAEEQGAQLDSPIGGLDIDAFDGLCEHLIVRDCVTQSVVGTYRILPGPASLAKGFYSEQEFDLAPLALDRDRTVEIGRSCVDRNYRDGAVIALLWSGLAAFMQRAPYTSLIGCASIAADDGGHRAASIYAGLSPTSLAPVHRRVTPHRPLPLERLDARGDATPPALVKGYLRSGAVVCGPPAYDPAFGSADLFTMLSVDRLAQRYARHYRRPISQAEAA